MTTLRRPAAPAAPARSRTPATASSSTAVSATRRSTLAARATPTPTPTAAAQDDGQQLSRRMDTTLDLGEHNKSKPSAKVSSRKLWPQQQSRIRTAASTSTSAASSSARPKQGTTTSSNSPKQDPTPPPERARQAMKTINSSLQAISALLKTRASAPTMAAKTTSKTSSSSSSSSSASSSSRPASTTPPPEIISLAKTCTQALNELRTLITQGKIDKNLVEIEKAAISFVAGLVETEHYRLALAELERIKTSLLRVSNPDFSSNGGAVSESSASTKTQTPWSSYAHLLCIPLPSSPTSPHWTPAEIATLVLSVQQYALGSLFRNPDFDPKLRATLVAKVLTSHMGAPIEWRDWWARSRVEIADDEGGAAAEVVAVEKKMDALMTSMFGSLIKGCVGLDGDVDINDLLTIRSRALLLYSTTSTISSSPEKLQALLDQCRKNLLLFGRQAEAQSLSAASINGPVQRVFQETIEAISSRHRGIEFHGTQWMNLCQVILRIAQRAEDGLAIERVRLLLESEEDEGGVPVEKQVDRLVVKLMGSLSGLQVGREKQKGKEREEDGLHRALIYVQALGKLRVKEGLDKESVSKVDSILEKVRSWVVKEVKGDQRLDMLVIQEGKQPRPKAEDEVLLRKLCETLAQHGEAVSTSGAQRGEQSRLISGTVEVLTVLAYSTLVVDDRSTYTPCFDHLERCLAVLGLSVESEGGIKIEPAQLGQAYWIRSLASAYYNLSGLLYNAGKPESTTRFVQRACEITRAVLTMSSSTVEDALVEEMDALTLASMDSEGSSRTKMERMELQADCWKYATKRFELLALAHHSIGEQKAALQAYVDALSFLPVESRDALGAALSVSDLLKQRGSMTTVKLVQRITKLATFDLLLHGDQVSLLEMLKASGFDARTRGMVLEVQVHTLEAAMDKLEAGNAIGALVQDLLELYDEHEFPIRRARILLRRMQGLCARGAVQKDLSAAIVAAEIDALCSTSVRRACQFCRDQDLLTCCHAIQQTLGQDATLASYKSHYLATSHLWLAFHAHQARLPSAALVDEARAAMGLFRNILDADSNELRTSTSRTPKKTTTPKLKTPSPAAATVKTGRVTTATRKRVLTSTAVRATATKSSAATALKTPRTVRSRMAVAEQITPPRQPLVDLTNDKAHSATTPKSKRAPAVDAEMFEDVDRCYDLIETMASLLGTLGHAVLRIGYLKLLRRMAPKRTRGTDEAYVASSIHLARELAKIGNSSRAATLFAQAEACIHQACTSGAAISLALQVEHHLLHAELLALTGQHERSSQSYTQALKLTKGLDDEDAVGSTSARIVQRTLLLQRVALASSVCSTMLQRHGDLGRCLAPALQAMRLLNRALANITRLSTIESTNKDESAFVSDRTDPNAPLPEHPAQTKQYSVSTAGPYASVLYSIADGLGSAILRVASLYWIRGTPKSAEYFAGHALDIATQYGANLPMMRAILLRCEVRMHAGNLEGAEEDLQAIDLENAANDSSELIEYHRLCAALHMRRRMIQAAKDDHAEAQSALEGFAQSTNQNEAGGSPIKVGTPKSVSIKDLSPFALRLGAKGHSPSHVSPSQRMGQSSDRILPAVHSRLLRMHIGLLRLERKQEECQDVLRRLGELPSLEEDKAEELRLHVMIEMQDLLLKFSTDAVLGMVPESVLSMPSLASSAAVTSSKTASPTKASPSHLHNLREIETLLQRAITMSVSRVRPAVLRELSLLSVSLRALLSSIGRADKKVAEGTAHLLDLGLAVTLRRDMLEAIDYRIANLSRVDDLKWPQIEPVPSHEQASAVASLLTLRERYRSETIEPVLTDPSINSILPPRWQTVSIHLSAERDALILVHHQANRQPLVFRLPLDRITRREDDEEDEGLSYAQASAELADIVERSNSGAQNAKNVEGKEARIAWWAERKELDARLKGLLQSMEDSWLGAFKCIFSDTQDFGADALNTFKGRIERIVKRSLIRATPNDKRAARFQLDDGIIKCIAALSPKARDEDLEDLYHFIMESFQLSGVPVACDEMDVDQVVIDFRSALEELHKNEPTPTPTSTSTTSDPKRHLVLILDKSVQGFPWESLPCLQGISISRLPSLAFLRDRLELARSRSDDGSHEYIVDPRRTSYVVNPGGDLKNTQARFEPWLETKAAEGWKGVVGRAPSEEEMKSSLASQELVLYVATYRLSLYFGHGGAEQYVRSQSIRHLPRCAVTMLWGCSSGVLRDQGEFDPYGTPYHYMIAGCPSLVANLWDVTDKDIDTLTENVFKLVGLHTDEATKSKNDKTTTKLSLSQAIAQSRQVCNLRYLNGAAVVNYGLPVWFSQ
ncbi:BZ3500_MvSof-1268-A1-R1_Chr6-2g08479 [Microbotryum saponariae]|uniref:separase n=1 Tax=Microbotryum saponariae TaxID=289078 RepID=A0A2X0NNH1_9BASI|nr:BZ3500_MvSof-1268-A1-R1_Chr6-2g08479 [Microbotryum saponariae]SDA07756.1 BZ3501_MvSof-1269-A2-R1_Chr6-1g08193 [Microbotryum saponariae]